MISFVPSTFPVFRQFSAAILHTKMATASQKSV